MVPHLKPADSLFESLMPLADCAHSNPDIAAFFKQEQHLLLMLDEMGRQLTISGLKAQELDLISVVDALN